MVIVNHVKGHPTRLSSLKGKEKYVSKKNNIYIAPSKPPWPTFTWVTTHFIDPGRMKGCIGLVGWPIADGLPT